MINQSISDLILNLLGYIGSCIGLDCHSLVLSHILDSSLVGLSGKISDGISSFVESNFLANVGVGVILLNYSSRI
jgi:hypothetical protein